MKYWGWGGEIKRAILTNKGLWKEFYFLSQELLFVAHNIIKLILKLSKYKDFVSSFKKFIAIQSLTSAERDKSGIQLDKSMEKDKKTFCFMSERPNQRRLLSTNSKICNYKKDAMVDMKLQFNSSSKTGTYLNLHEVKCTWQIMI